jgi:hypothetical protein
MQNRKTVAALAVAALAVAVALFIVLQGGSGSDDREASRTSLDGGSGSDDRKAGRTSSDEGSGSDDRKAGRTFRFQLADEKAVGGPRQVEATEGDRVTVSLQTDVPAELHIHGYELEKEIEAGATGSIAFAADATGGFEIEAHPAAHGEEEAGVELGELRVNP